MPSPVEGSFLFVSAFPLHKIFQTQFEGQIWGTTFGSLWFLARVKRRPQNQTNGRGGSYFWIFRIHSLDGYHDFIMENFHEYRLIKKTNCSILSQRSLRSLR
jgi:hypothetical protein